MSRSPIEIMVDKACGITSGDLATTRVKTRLDHATEALLAVADAAVAWSENPSNESETALLRAVAAWKVFDDSL